MFCCFRFWVLLILRLRVFCGVLMGVLIGAVWFVVWFLGLLASVGFVLIDFGCLGFEVTYLGLV